MTGKSYAANLAALPGATLNALFFEAVDRFGDAAAFQRLRTADVIEDISYADAVELVRKASGGLVRAGVSRGDRVAILSENRIEKVYAIGNGKNRD